MVSKLGIQQKSKFLSPGGTSTYIFFFRSSPLPLQPKPKVKIVYFELYLKIINILLKKYTAKTLVLIEDHTKWVLNFNTKSVEIIPSWC